MLRLNHYLFLTKAVFVSFSCPLNTKLQGQFEFQKQPSQQLWPMKTLILAPSAFPALSEKEDSITLNPHLSSRPTFPHVLTCWLCVSNQAKNGEMSMLNEKIGVCCIPKGALFPKQSVATALQPKEIKGNGCSCEHQLCTCIKSKSSLHDIHVLK